MTRCDARHERRRAGDTDLLPYDGADSHLECVPCSGNADSAMFSYQRAERGVFCEVFFDRYDVCVNIEDSSDAIRLRFIADNDGVAFGVMRDAQVTSYIRVILNRLQSRDGARTEEVEDGVPVVGSLIADSNRHCGG